ncbi:nitrile hydratase subunit beta [Sneathiella marina]|uniref:Nitrile hydratase subunit beta n=1 Tax=Sneathiella marina TaxID=2950108 RepID=A0ABY4W9D3_9PROT|nr:SH3-like domain-containing protein [Sneathiella marina]USG62537.1 nitrile hydratase subunit beta [Sneathiella marina]
MPLLTTDIVPGLLGTGASARIDEDIAPKFSTGDAVEIRNINPVHHTRLPRYVRGKKGTVDRDHGVFAFPDTSAHGKGETPQHVYSVKFSFQELWGEDHSDNMFLYIDMFDDYMRAAS